MGKGDPGGGSESRGLGRVLINMRCPLGECWTQLHSLQQVDLVVSYWKVIKSVRLSVTDFAFSGSFDRLALPEFKTL
jgi:hypothetical protein